jgi:hypothetical protein
MLWKAEGQDIWLFGYPNRILLDMSNPLVLYDPPTPTPEPASILLLGSGLLDLAGLGRRFRKS